MEQEFIDKYMAGLIKSRSSSSLSSNMDVEDADPDDGQMADDDKNDQENTMELAQFQAWLAGNQLGDPPCTPRSAPEAEPPRASVAVLEPQSTPAAVLEPQSAPAAVLEPQSAPAAVLEPQSVPPAAPATTACSKSLWKDEACKKCCKSPCRLFTCRNK